MVAADHVCLDAVLLRIFLDGVQCLLLIAMNLNEIDVVAIFLPTVGEVATV
jgi:hypothetical protein